MPHLILLDLCVQMKDPGSNQQGQTGFRVLMVEDDTSFASMVQQVILSEGGQFTHANTLAKAREIAMQQAFDLVMLDNHLPDGKAYDFFDFFSRRNPDAPILMLTGLPDVREAITLTRNGLFDYLTKPVGVDTLVATLKRALTRIRSKSASDGKIWLGESPEMRAIEQQLEQASRHGTVTVLLTGESGVGKDVAARALHSLTCGGQPNAAPFVAVNCAALPSEMFESELFGAERGAYTGADRKRAGLVAAAQGGTLFLDEIGEVPILLQAKLLRFLEAREFRSLGSTSMERFTGRVVAATNKVLRTEVAAGRFREDLLFRLEVMSVEIPPLRRRIQDLPTLAESLLAQLSERYGAGKPMIRSEDMALMLKHPFPGNIRELRNVLERALLRTPPGSSWLQIDPVWLQAASTAPVPTAPPPSMAAAPAGATPTDASSEALPEERKSLSALDAQEYRMIRAALKDAKGGIRRAAGQLGISPQALLRRLDKWPELRGPDEPA